MDSEKIQEKIKTLEYVIDGLETAIAGLEEADKKEYKDEIGKLIDLKNYCEMDIEKLEKEFDEQVEIEQEEYKAEMEEMNYQFERSRI